MFVANPLVTTTHSQWAASRLKCNRAGARFAALCWLRSAMGALLILACVLSPPLAAQAPGHATTLTVARDLAAEARQAAAQGKAYVVLFSETGCPWCERARREFLLPMQADPQVSAKAVFRQINIDSDEALRDFGGRATTHRRFAQSEGLRFYPTVALYTPQGAPAAEKLTGFTNAVYYGSSIERRIDAALAKITATRTQDQQNPPRK